jgi:hypothetical protein
MSTEWKHFFWQPGQLTIPRTSRIVRGANGLYGDGASVGVAFIGRG